MDTARLYRKLERFFVAAAILLPMVVGILSLTADHKPLARLHPLSDLWSMFFLILMFWVVYWMYDGRARIHPGIILFALLAQAAGLICAFAAIYRVYGLDGMPPPLDRETAVYFSIVTWTTLGYGDLKPSETVRLTAAAQALLGYLYLGLVVGVSMRLTSIPIGKHGQRKA